MHKHERNLVLLKASCDRLENLCILDVPPKTMAQIEALSNFIVTITLQIVRDLNKNQKSEPSTE